MMHPIAQFLPVFAPTSTPDTGWAPPPMTMPDMGMSDMSMTDDMAMSDMSMAEPSFLDEDLASSGDDEGVRIAQARDEALAEAAIATEAALAAQAAEFEVRHADAVVEERRRWAEQESAVLSEQLRGGLEALEKALAEGVVEVLQPFLARAVRAQAAEELRQAVTQLLAAPDTGLIRIGGPADLVDPLREAFTDQGAIEIAASEAPEVTIEAGDTTIRTQLQSWASTLDGHLGEAN